MPLALICSYTSWTMPNKGIYLPNIWSERFIPVIPESQSKDVQELLNETDCTCICVDEYPANGQDWVETILMFLGEKFASNLFVAQTMEALQDASRAAFSPPARRGMALKAILQHLSNGKKLVLYIRRPVSHMIETDFEHLSHFIGPTIGILCHATSETNVPLSLQPTIRYHIMRQMINPNQPVFFSYSREDSIGLVDTICKALESTDIEYSLDMIDTRLQDSIKEYERKIGDAEYIIIVISDNYFYSRDCMYEMSAIMRRDDFSKRVVLVDKLEKIKRNKKSHDIVLAHWQKEYDDYIDIDPSNQTMTEERHHLEGIIQKFPVFWRHVVDDLAEDYKKVEKDSAKTLAEFMSTMIKRNNNAVQAPQMQILNDPVHSGDTPSIEVRQIGAHPVYIGNINGDVHFGA